MDEGAALEVLRSGAVEDDTPDGRAPVVSHDVISRIALHFKAAGWQIEALALENGIYPRRYLRSMNGIGRSEQVGMLRGRVSQVGLGGLGGLMVETLARSGVGRIRAVDGDVFEESNLNRQALSGMNVLGRPKAEAAVERCRSINPSVELSAEAAFLDRAGFLKLLEDCDVAVDALGGLRDRPALQEAASERGVPLVTGALAGWTGYVGVVMPGQLGPGDIMGSDDSAEDSLGCPAPTVNLVSSIMAREVMRILTGKESPLAGTMLIIDMNGPTFETVSL
ncbi:HesA/MoeB/ThiF family protein [Desulfovibrio oxyclinae]|uniref:HesA/MoeB/ThiF family protein n=1 Tax=Desulfovibrio oxyclinae TaxID=63560 RepID=UPI00037B022A|nr:ThiF family adenylyltransferase [Desulfovibrio oxyclinae]